ncbi:MAG: DHH family phosphoesterase [Alistipes indistinctus]
MLIDHHLHPPLDEYALSFSDVKACSTSYIVYRLIMALAGEEAITRPMAESLYVGIMTDTGNFACSILDADLFRAVARADRPRHQRAAHLQRRVQQFLGGRMRLLGYVLNDKDEAAVGTRHRRRGADRGRRCADSISSRATRRDSSTTRFRSGESSLSAIFIETHRDIRVAAFARRRGRQRLRTPLLLAAAATATLRGASLSSRWRA